LLQEAFLALILSLGSDPELLLLRSQVLERSGHSVITVSNSAYAVAVFRSARFEAVIFCHKIPGAVRDKLMDEMLLDPYRDVPMLVYRKPLAPGADATLIIVGNKTAIGETLCKELVQTFRFSNNGSRHSLQSWKEIAAYMGRGVRTVQRWEQFGLPVHRPSGTDRGAVFVLVAELEQWMKSVDQDSASVAAD
jgi:hypothetical protein